MTRPRKAALLERMAQGYREPKPGPVVRPCCRDGCVLCEVDGQPMPPALWAEAQERQAERLQRLATYEAGTLALPKPPGRRRGARILRSDRLRARRA